MKELHSEAILAPDRDWIQPLIDERRRGDADGRPWMPADVRTFAVDYETEAKTADDLFRIVVNRLHDLQDDVERSDNSRREEVALGADEYVLRRWLARNLNKNSRRRYTVPQESEIDEEQRPDIRAENPKTDPVSIEV